jgi:zinc protease
VHYGTEQMTLVVVGNVNIAQLRDEVAGAFGNWKNGVPQRPANKAPPNFGKGVLEHNIFMPDKSSVSVLLGQPTGLRYRDSDNLALRMATAILGLGFTGRLMANIRDRDGLTYGIGASLSNDVFDDGDWKISTTFTPELLIRGVAAVREQVVKWHETGVTLEELERRKENMAGGFQVSLGTTDGIAGTLLHTANCGLEVAWLDDFPGKIRRLELAETNAAIRRYINPSSLLLVTAGSVPR